MAGVSKKVINVFGMAKLHGTDVLKVELATYNGRPGVDVRGWYKKDEEKVTEQDKASMDGKGYMPGKGFFLPLTHVEWLAKKLEAVLTNEDFKKLLVEVKTTKTDDKTATDDKLAKENAALAKQLAEMQAQMAKLLAATEKGKSEAAAGKSPDAADELEDLVVESSVTRGKGKGSGKK